MVEQLEKVVILLYKKEEEKVCKKKRKGVMYLSPPENLLVCSPLVYILHRTEEIICRI